MGIENSISARDLWSGILEPKRARQKRLELSLGFGWKLEFLTSWQVVTLEPERADTSAAVNKAIGLKTEVRSG